MLFLKNKLKAGEPKKTILQNPKILEVNLIKDEIKISFDWRKNFSVLLIVLVVSGLFLTEIYFGLDWWEKQENVRLEVISQRTAQVSQEVTKLKNAADEAMTYKDKAGEVGNLLNNHVYWSNFFSWLEKNTLSSVKYGSFKGDLSGIYTLNAKTRSFAEVSWQVKAFLKSSTTKAAEVASANLASGEGGDNEKKDREVTFNLKLEVDPEIFKK